MLESQSSDGNPNGPANRFHGDVEPSARSRLKRLFQRRPWVARLSVVALLFFFAKGVLWLVLSFLLVRSTLNS